jgi:hypothetical protein
MTETGMVPVSEKRIEDKENNVSLSLDIFSLWNSQMETFGCKPTVQKSAL